ncbi:MAG: hypothetical protein ACKVG4_15510 [Longimicrobiales bacterium]
MASTLPFHQTREGCRLLGVERHAISVERGEVGLQMLRTRALPGVRLARVPRFGRGLTLEQVVEAIEGLRTPASESRVPQINDEVYVEDPDRHHAVEAALEEGGLQARRDDPFVRAHPMDGSGAVGRRSAHVPAPVRPA